MWYPEGHKRSLSMLFNQCTVEALRMRWPKSDRWKAGIAIAGMLLLLVLMVWVPVSKAGADEGVSGLAIPETGTVQATPTEDATVTTLNKEKLAQEVQQLKNQNAPDLFDWLRTNAAVLLSTLVVVIGGLIGLFRWLGDRRDEQEKRREDQRSEQEKQAEEQKRWLEDRQAEREKRAEERFQAVVEGLGSEREEAKVGAAIILRTFLRPGYEQFYSQAFDLAVTHLRLRRASDPPGGPDTLSQALIAIFKKAFPLARSQKEGDSQSLDATGVKLDCAFLWKADLEHIWMPRASLLETNLAEANLHGAFLALANLHKVNLWGADLRQADLGATDLSEADLSEAKLWANLHKAKLLGTNLHKAHLCGDTYSAELGEANLTGAKLCKADLRKVKLWGADLSRADLSEADLSGANLGDALSLKDANLYGVKGLTKEQLEACKAKGAIIDEDTTTSPLQSTVSTPPSLQSNDAQAP